MTSHVAPVPLELDLHLAGAVEVAAFVRQRRPLDVAAQMLQPLAVVSFDPYRSVQAEVVDFGAVALALQRGAIRRPLGLPAKGMHDGLPKG